MRFLFRPVYTLAIALACISVCMAKLEVVYEWKYIDYSWEDTSQEQHAIDSEIYDLTTILPTDIQPMKDGSVIVATPKYKNNPASLSTISGETGDGGPLLKPYPDWSWHTKEDCSGITSVSTVFVDDYEGLWMVDSGMIEDDQVCPAKILKFDYETKELLLEVEIPFNFTRNPIDTMKGQLEIHAVEITDEGVWVYISDLVGYSMIIWDEKDMWRVASEIFEGSGKGGDISIQGENTTVISGPLSIALTPSGYLEENFLMVKALSSEKTLIVATKDLHESKSGNELVYYGANLTGSVPDPAKYFAKDHGTLFAGFIGESSIACWNIQYPLDGDHIITLETNTELLQYISSVKVIQGENDGTETLAIMSNRMHKFLGGTINFDEINFRVLVTDVGDFIAGTFCEPQAHEISETIEEKNFIRYVTEITTSF